MLGIAINVLVIFILIIMNGLFAMSEIAIVSAKKIRLQRKSEEGDDSAQTALELANEPNLFLSTVQVGISLVGVLAGAFGGATIATKVAVYLEPIPVIGNYSGLISMVLVVGFITYLSLIIGELVPKRLALSHPEKLAMIMAKPMSFLSKITSPIVAFLSKSTDLVLKIIGAEDPDEAPVTEEEIRVMIEQGTQAGMVDVSEQEMLERVFEFDDRRVSGLMTPRSDIQWLDLEDELEENLKKIKENVYSRYIVSKGELDNVIGVVKVKNLLKGFFAEGNINLEAYLDQPPFVPESMPAIKVLRLFKQSETHMALVINEYAHIVGLVSMHDIMEFIVGDLPEEEGENSKIVQREDGSWLVDGSLTIKEFIESFNIEELPDMGRTNYQTLAGFVMMNIERVPREGDNFDWNGFCFEVIDMDGNRVDKVLIRKI